MMTVWFWDYVRVGSGQRRCRWEECHQCSCGWRYGVTTVQPVLPRCDYIWKCQYDDLGIPNWATTYRPRKPVAPNTVAVMSVPARPGWCFKMARATWLRADFVDSGKATINPNPESGEFIRTTKTNTIIKYIFIRINVVSILLFHTKSPLGGRLPKLSAWAAWYSLCTMLSIYHNTTDN